MLKDLLFLLFPKLDRYWIGKQDGWFACEKMVMDRAKDKGYDTKKIWEDLLQ